MKSDYKIYKRNELEEVYSKLNKNEREVIDDFINYCSINGISERKLQDIKRSIIQFRHIVERNFDKLSLADLRNYLTLLNTSGRKRYTTNGVKNHIKRFLKWKYPDWSSRFDNLTDIKLVQAFNEEKINEGTLLKKEDIEKIMIKEKDLMKKTFFISLYESGLRPMELRSLKWENVSFNVDGDVSQLNIFATKTNKARTVYIKEATFYLLKLRDHKKNDFVFSSRQGSDNFINKNTATSWIKGMGKYIGKPIFPYLLRHSRATELYLNMPSKIAQKFMGHSKDMSDLYSHFSSQDVKDSLLKTVYNFKELPPQKMHELERQVKELLQFKTEIAGFLDKNNLVPKGMAIYQHRDEKPELVDLEGFKIEDHLDGKN